MNRDNNAVNDGVLFDDLALMDPAIYARAKRAHAFAFVVIGVLLLIGVIASFFVVYLLIIVTCFCAALSVIYFANGMSIYGA